MEKENELYNEDWRRPLKGAKVSSDIKPERVDKMCRVCASPLRANGMVYPTSPPQYEHVCDRCGNVEVFFEKYPYIDFGDGFHLAYD